MKYRGKTKLEIWSQESKTQGSSEQKCRSGCDLSMLHLNVRIVVIESETEACELWKPV